MQKTKDSQWVLTFDISSKATGYAYGSDDKVTKYGKYVAQEDSQTGQALVEFSKWVSKLINGLPYAPKIVLIEAPYYNRNANTFSVLSKFVGVAQREVYRILQIEASMMPSSTVKKVIDVPEGKTYRDRKYNMVKKINALLGVNLDYHKTNKNKSDDDVADAIALLLVHFILQKRSAK